jgi:2-phosphoglycerate kinase
MTENGREKFLTKDFIEKALELVKDKPVEEITIEDVDESYAKILRQQKQDEAKKAWFLRYVQTLS